MYIAITMVFLMSYYVNYAEAISFGYQRGNSNLETSNHLVYLGSKGYQKGNSC